MVLETARLFDSAVFMRGFREAVVGQQQFGRRMWKMRCDRTTAEEMNAV
jgi:hypothetical protein